MADVFVSYKREDQARVTPLVDGLTGAGLSVWWDTAIPGGEAWRRTIIEQLEAARCVIVVWSQLSVGPAGEFVHEEAGLAKTRGVLLPVRIDRVTPPLGFGQLQALDLIRWRGDVRDLRFGDVVAAAKAVLEGGPRPAPKAPAQRLRRVSALTVGGLAVTLLLGFMGDVAGLQAGGCRIPGIRAGCAALGLGGVPTRAEEARWSGRTPGDCSALRDYVDRFPNGAYADEAARRLAAVRHVDDTSWTLEERRLPLTVRPTLTGLGSEAAARTDAVRRALAEARSLCESYEAAGDRLDSVSTESHEWRCSQRAGGTACGFDGQVVCHIAVRSVIPRQVCP